MSSNEERLSEREWKQGEQVPGEQPERPAGMDEAIPSTQATSTGQEHTEQDQADWSPEPGINR